MTLVCGCSNPPAEVQNTIRLLDGEEAATTLITDDYEGYFNDLSDADIRLQMALPDSVAISAEAYRQWLSELHEPWPDDLSQRANGLIIKALQECADIFPDLAPDTVDLILTDDLPYGSSVYFTRGRAIVCPKSHLKNASERELMHVFRHELFHLISRQHQEVRPDMYKAIGFESVTDSLTWPGELYQRRLLNPDAPRPDYALDVDGILYVPLVYVSQSPYDVDDPDYFGKQLRFQYFQMHGDSLRPPTLTVTEVRELTGDLTNYIIHPEEILADHFALLLEMGAAGNNEYLLGLERLLKPL